MGCRYVVARPSAISSPPTYTEARIHLEAPLMIHLLRWNESSKQQQGKERLWSTIYNNGLRYALTNTHDGLTGTAAVIEHVCVAYYLGGGVSREERRRRVNTGCCWRSSREKTSKSTGSVTSTGRYGYGSIDGGRGKGTSIRRY